MQLERKLDLSSETEQIAQETQGAPRSPPLILSMRLPPLSSSSAPSLPTSAASETSVAVQTAPTQQQLSPDLRLRLANSPSFPSSTASAPQSQSQRLPPLPSAPSWRQSSQPLRLSPAQMPPRTLSGQLPWSSSPAVPLITRSQGAPSPLLSANSQQQQQPPPQQRSPSPSVLPLSSHDAKSAKYKVEVDTMLRRLQRVFDEAQAGASRLLSLSQS